jgi:kynurenine formamidase
VKQLPTQEEFDAYFEELSNWGRWGPDDRIGTLNLITPAVRARAAQLIETGELISLARDMDPKSPDPLQRGTVLQRFMQEHGEADIREITSDYVNEIRLGGVREYVGMIAHGSNTHLDGLAHSAWKGLNYNGFKASDTTSMGGSASLSVHQAYEGIVSRGILLDVPALTGRPWLEPGEAVFPEDLEAAEESQGVRVEEGDVLLLYTGNFKRIESEGLHPELHHPGYAAACLPWLRDRGVSMISSDNINDVKPSGYDRGDMIVPVHSVSLVAMGLWLTDNMILDELAAKCTSTKRWEFFFALLPWRLVGVTASPVNPVAIF